METDEREAKKDPNTHQMTPSLFSPLLIAYIHRKEKE